MKISFKIFAAFLLAGVFFACKRNISDVNYQGGTAPTLSADRTGTIPLSFVNQNNEAIKLMWTNPAYQFSTGVSSQDVSYLIEIDTTGANFKNPARKQIIVAKDMSVTITQSDFNGYLLNDLNLRADMPHNIEIRITSRLANNSVPLTSNVLKYTVTPYSIPPKVAPPASGKLFITGSATPASWQCGCGEPELTSQQFTQVSPTDYVINSITLTGGGSYLFIPVYGSWSEKYGYSGSNNANNVNGDDLKYQGGDILAPAVSGNYKIEVDFQRGKFIVTKL